MKRSVTEDSFWELFPGASFGVVVAQGMKPAARSLSRRSLPAIQHTA